MTVTNQNDLTRALGADVSDPNALSAAFVDIFGASVTGSALIDCSGFNDQGALGDTDTLQAVIGALEARIYALENP